ncbi:succinyl-diaminopimelate desuccinylase [Maridesulfovibrio ferrireducens]|uniref:Succinyl-diaminopimelate desuccinylase n=1 Tax=Maridesulfovibrio ferrireducens TaxID=246191 RepID=A0A1G9HM85_9BACT|nr:M20 family metallo-hydrolase [Maridesulfovibrio ferrireducens]SDL13844.1 succinyl-diaminopimelate desuccinylase [Maridesulfovibrio ferrireducens]
MPGQLLSKIDALKDTALELHSKLVSIPAIGPTNNGGGEKDKADFLTSYLKEHGFGEVKSYNAPDDRVECGYRPNLVTILPGQDRSKTLWIISHMDVVPVGDLSLWDNDPFTLVQDGDDIYGRGTEDNHQGIVSSILAARALKECGMTPGCNVGLIFVSDEETGSEYGLEYMLKEHENLFKKNDLFLVPDSGSADSSMVEVAEKSTIWLKVTVEGKQCHASTPEHGVNSLVAAAALIVEIPELHFHFDEQDELFSPPYSTFTPTKKEANVENINTMPGKDVFYIDCRVLPNYDLKEVIEQVEGMGNYVAEEFGVKVTVEIDTKNQAAPQTSIDAEIVEKTIFAIKEIYGVDAKACGIGGGTVAAHLRERGYQAVVWSTLLNQAHQPNEKGSLANTLGDAKVMVLLPF